MGHTLIERGDLELLVPQQAVLPEDQILAFLQHAEMQPLRFVVLVGQLTQAENHEVRPGFFTFTQGRDRAHADAMCAVAESRLPFPDRNDAREDAATYLAPTDPEERTRASAGEHAVVWKT
jgi:hypothetical protein